MFPTGKIPDSLRGARVFGSPTGHQTQPGLENRPPELPKVPRKRLLKDSLSPVRKVLCSEGSRIELFGLDSKHQVGRNHHHLTRTIPSGCGTRTPRTSDWAEGSRRFLRTRRNLDGNPIDDLWSDLKASVHAGGPGGTSGRPHVQVCNVCLEASAETETF